jgi:DNA polymerase-3 subunit delta
MIIFLYGADAYRSKVALNNIKNKFIKEIDPEESSLSFLDGQNADLKTIISKLNTGSLFTKKRLSIIENVFKNKKSTIFSGLITYLKNLEKDDGNIVIFREEPANEKTKALNKEEKTFFDFLTKQKYSQEFKVLHGDALLVFMKKEAQSYNKEISLSAAKLLISYFGSDLWSISREIKKLAFSSEENIISLEATKKSAKESFEEDIFALSDAISAKDNKAAYSLLEKQKAAGLSDEYLLSMIIRQIKILLLVKDETKKNNDPAKIATKLKLHPYVVKKSLAQIKNFNETDLKNLFNRLINIDFLNKSGKSTLENELSLFISEL